MSRLGSPLWNQLKRVFGTPARRRLAHAALLVDAVRHWESAFAKLSDDQMKQTALHLRGRARGGESLDRILPEAFGLVCVAAQRTIGLRPFDVQIAAGVVLHRKGFAELATGEGKTLVASMPATLNALAGRGVHVTTVNDYLARRDCDWMRPIYESVGLTVAALQMNMPDAQRHHTYRCDITYGMASEFGFDFLRDRLRIRGQGQTGTPFWNAWSGNGQPAGPLDQKVQREHYYAIVDEADSILIDEARTPLIISTATREATAEESVAYVWADALAQRMEMHRHFTLDHKKQKIELTEEARQLARWSNPPSGKHSHAMDKLHEHIERALQAHHRFRRDQHYMLEKEKVVIIDEFTGRRMPDRHWREGLHQAVEAKEGVPITVAADHAAQITFQNFFRMYKKMGGMSGTLAPNWMEFLRVYKMPVVVLPTNRELRRDQWPDLVFGTEEAKFDAVVREVQTMMAKGRPVLIGTRSVEKSENLSEKLSAAGVPHQVLNARQHELEAQIVARAGEPGHVTIATNMAGRGTDIKVSAEIAQAGGLHVLGTERHEARRIDRQLAGRAGRQGDPGSCQFFLSLEDELLEALGPGRQARLVAQGQAGVADWNRYRPVFLKAQSITERRHYIQRVDLMVYDKQRQEILKELGADPYVD